MNSLPVISWFDKSTVKHLRFPFSFFLLPVYLFALSQAPEIDPWNALLVFIILHLLVYPSSNGYNSYEDKDEGSIGGLKSPPRITRNLYKVSILFDGLAVLASLIIFWQVAFLVLVFILMSRAYSYRKIRIKKYPIPAFITVFIFQGGHIYLISEMAIADISMQAALDNDTLICMLISSMFIGSMYPLTQIYQHESDRKDGVISISYMLGYRGTFIFSGILFTIGTLMLVYYFLDHRFLPAVVLFVLLLSPVMLRMGKWFNKVKKNARHASFENTMLMNKLTSGAMNLYFMILIVYNLIM